MARILATAGERVVAVEAAGPGEVLGANTIAEMMELDREMRLATARAADGDGRAIIQRPDTVIIDTGVEVGADTVIEPFVQLLGTTRSAAIAAFVPTPFWSTPPWPIRF